MTFQKLKTKTAAAIKSANRVINWPFAMLDRGAAKIGLKMAMKSAARKALREQRFMRASVILMATFLVISCALTWVLVGSYLSAESLLHKIAAGLKLVLLWLTYLTSLGDKFDRAKRLDETRQMVIESLARDRRYAAMKREMDEMLRKQRANDS